MLVTHNMQQAARVLRSHRLLLHGRAGGVRHDQAHLHQPARRARTEDYVTGQVRLRSGGRMPAGAHTSKVYEQELTDAPREAAPHGQPRRGDDPARARPRSARATPRWRRRRCRLDRRINRLECEVDELCHAHPARPASRSRPICASSPPRSRSSPTWSASATSCVNICERVVELNEEPPLAPVGDVSSSLADEAHRAWCTTRSTRWWRRDVDRATALLARDDVIDEHYARDLPGGPRDDDAATRAPSTGPRVSSRSPSTWSASAITR